LIRSKCLCILLLLSLLFLPACGQSAQGTEIIILDVGKADAIIITDGETTALIDTGENKDGKKILACLLEKNIHALDVMIITHFDKDHVGGADVVLEGIPVGAVYDAYYEPDTKQYQQYIEAIKATGTPRYRVTASMALPLSLGTLTLLPSFLSSTDDNDMSLVVSMTAAQHTYLFAADATTARMEGLLSDGIGQHDFIKMPHHGRYYSNLPALLDAVNPSIAAITDSDKNPASDQTLALLSTRGIETLRTRDGDIRITDWDGKMYQNR